MCSEAAGAGEPLSEIRRAVSMKIVVKESKRGNEKEAIGSQSEERS